MTPSAAGDIAVVVPFNYLLFLAANFLHIARVFAMRSAALQTKTDPCCHSSEVCG
jgi:hypothetical protein